MTDAHAGEPYRVGLSLGSLRRIVDDGIVHTIRGDGTKRTRNRPHINEPPGRHLPSTGNVKPATGRVSLHEGRVGHEEVTRADTALTLIALLDAPQTAGRVLELINGTVPLGTAVDELGGDTGPSVHGDELAGDR